MLNNNSQEIIMDYKKMAERAHFDATHKKIDGGPGSGRKKGSGGRSLNTWKEGYNHYHGGGERPTNSGSLMAKKGWDDAKFGDLPTGAMKKTKYKHEIK